MKFDWWTLALQTVNVLILLWVLRRFLFKPVQAIIIQRQQELQKLTEDVVAEKQLAANQRTALEAERASLENTREQAVATARDDARTAGQVILAQAAAEAERRTVAAQQAIKREREEAEKLLQHGAAQLSGEIARRLLERVPQASADGDFLRRACDAIVNLRQEERALLMQSDARDPLQIVSASPADTRQQAAVLDALSAVLGIKVCADFSSDVALLAGIELRFRHLVIRSNWSTDLRQIMEALNNEPHRIA
jgi:F-type H+-transporting ATPase subunit b